MYVLIVRGTQHATETKSYVSYLRQKYTGESAYVRIRYHSCKRVAAEIETEETASEKDRMKRTTSKSKINRKGEKAENKIKRIKSKNATTQETRQHAARGIRTLARSQAPRGWCSTETKEQYPPPRRAGKRK